MLCGFIYWAQVLLHSVLTLCSILDSNTWAWRLFTRQNRLRLQGSLVMDRRPGSVGRGSVMVLACAILFHYLTLIFLSHSLSTCHCALPHRP